MPALPWFRLYHEVLDDPKVQRLPDAMFRHWVNVLCLANRGNPRGRLSADVKEIAYGLRLSPAKTRHVLAELSRYGLLETDPDIGRLMPTNWDNRQRKSDSSAERVAKHRATERDRNVTVPLPETLPVTPLEKEKEKEREEETETRTLATRSSLDEEGSGELGESEDFLQTFSFSDFQSTIPPLSENGREWGEGEWADGERNESSCVPKSSDTALVWNPVTGELEPDDVPW